jgi:hypothetical protein
VPLGPAQVHPLQHLGEVRRVDTTGAGTDRDEGLALVVLTGEQRADLERLDRLGDRAQLLLGLGDTVGVVLLAGELDQHAEVLDPRPQPGDALHIGLQAGQPGRHLLRVRLVVPQVRRGDLLAQVGDLRTQGREIEHLLDRGQRRVELLELSIKIQSSHNHAAYPLTPRGR